MRCFLVKREKDHSLLFIILILTLFACMLFLSSKCEVRAEELDDYSNADLSQDERLNALELRLEELGYAVSDLGDSIVFINESETLEDEQRLAISDKLDLLILGINTLIDNDLIAVEKSVNDDALTAEYRLAVLESFKENGNAIDTLKQDTVSGNSVLTETFKTSQKEVVEVQKENISLFEEYQTYLLIFVGIVIGCIIASIFSRYLHNGK